MTSAELPSASSGPAGLTERQTWGTRSRQGTLAQAQTNTVALVSVHVLKCLHFFFPPRLFFFPLHASTCEGKSPQMRRPVSYQHVTFLRSSAVSSHPACLQHTRLTVSLMAHCARLLHISPGGEQHRNKYHITEAESCSSRFTDLSFPLLFHQPGRALREWEWKIVCSIHLFRFRSLLL